MSLKKFSTYTVIFEKAKEGGYIAFVPALPGCVTQGETFEEMNKNIKDAMTSYIEILQEDGDEIPLESNEQIAATITIPLKA